MRCILGIGQTYPDRRAGMYETARGHCRSLSEDPRRARKFGGPTAGGAPRSFRPHDAIREEELGEGLPITHVLFLPKEENRHSVSCVGVGKSDKSDEEGVAMQITTESRLGGTGASSSSAAPKSIEASAKSCRSRRSDSRVRCGQQIVKVVRLANRKAGFGRRGSLAAGPYQLLKQNRKVSPQR